ncbi:MAG: TolC family protein [Gemmatimonadaceae bacterium]
MRFRLTVFCALLAALPVDAVAQRQDNSTAAVLTVQEAISLATRFNPDHRQVIDLRRSAGAALRSSYGALLPSASAQFSSQYQKGGVRPINGVTFSTSSDVYQSSYWLGLQYQVDAGTFLSPRAQRANVDATEADIVGSQENLRALVTQRYLTALQSEAGAQLQDTLVVTAEAQLELARARTAVGSGTQLDITRAEVTLGQQRVAALQAHNQVEIDKLRLFQAMGVPKPASVRLTSQFAVSEPTFSLDSLQALARRENPQIKALRSRDKASTVNVRVARADYLPSLSLSTGWGGYTYEFTNPDFIVGQAQSQGLGLRANCITTDSIRFGSGLQPLGGCDNFLLNDAAIASLRAGNDQFPFDFTRQPMSLSASVSLPIFNGFLREQRVEEAEVQRDAARHRARAGELQVTADVTAAYLTVMTQARTVALQEQNSKKAAEELSLAQERYRAGAATFLDVTTARASYEQAESDRITAIYEYHKAFAALESAVGRPLR